MKNFYIKKNFFQTKVVLTKWRRLGGRGGCRMNPAPMGVLPWVLKYPRRPKGKENVFTWDNIQVVGVLALNLADFLPSKKCQLLQM